MNPLKTSKVKTHRKKLEKKETIPKEANTDVPLENPRNALAKKYDSSGLDKHGYKTEPSPNSSPSIEFKPQNGSPFGFPYAYLQHWYFEEENTVLILMYSSGIVKISGCNLDGLFKQVSQYKVKEIYVTDKSEIQDNQTEIESIIVKRNMEVEL